MSPTVGDHPSIACRLIDLPPPSFRNVALQRTALHVNKSMRSLIASPVIFNCFILSGVRTETPRKHFIISSIRTKCTNTQTRKNNKGKQQWQRRKYN